MEKNMKNAATGSQMPLFSEPREQGHREWSMFNVVRHDPVGAFRVLTPRKNTTPRYPNVLHISRQPRRITPIFAR